MLETLVSVTNFIKTGFYYVLYGSYKTGYFLVNWLNLTFHYLSYVVDNFITFFTVFYECVAIFLQDNFQFLQQILVVAISIFDTVCSGISTAFCKLSTIICAVVQLIVGAYSLVLNVLSAVVTCIGQIITYMKILVVLFGSGVCFLITLVPLLLYYTCILIISCIHSLSQEILDLCYTGVSSARTFVENSILFVIDVPFESVAGLLVAFSLIYVFCQFYILISSYIKRKLRNLQNWCRQQIRIRNLYQRLLGQLIGSQTSKCQRQAPQIEQRSTKSKHNNSGTSDEKCCIICQERNKCVLLLPCRHLCLCAECTRELRYYNETCPICRTNIDSTMRVYV